MWCRKERTIAVDELLAEARATLERGTLPVPAAIRKLAASQPIPEGKRNDTLMRLGASLRAKGLDEDEIRAALLDENNRRCTPPLDDAEVHQIARSVARYTRRTPCSASTSPIGATPSASSTPTAKTCAS
jgi:hypothetical protein